MSENHDPAQGNGDFGSYAIVKPSVDSTEVSEGSGDELARVVDSEETSVGLDNQEVGELRASNIQDTVSSEVNHADHIDGVVLDFMQENPNDVKTSDESMKEDMFVDCPDELNPDVREVVEISANSEKLEEKDNPGNTSLLQIEHKEETLDLKGEMEHLRYILEKTLAEKDNFIQEHEKERLALAHLQHQLKALNEEQLSLDIAKTGDTEVKGLPFDTSSLEILNECSMFIKRTTDEQLHAKNVVRELHAISFMKDQEIENLKGCVDELSASHGAIYSFMNSIHENMFKYTDADKDQQIDTMVRKILSSLVAIMNPGKMLDESVTDTIFHVEKSSSLLINKYNQFVSELHLLKQALVDLEVDCSMPDETTIILAARGELFDLKIKQVDLESKLSHLEDENRKLVEQLDKQKQLIDLSQIEIGRISAELEQEKTRCANTKEKLSMAVTKGKALIQQRDSLKQSLADKISELDKCLIELQEKSTALEASQLRNEALVNSEDWAASLQGDLSQRDSVLQRCEEILSATLPSELHQLDIVEKVRSLAYERNSLRTMSLEFQKVEDLVSSSNFPEIVLSSVLESRVSWLVESFSLAKGEVIRLQDETARIREAADNEIDHLTTSFLIETLEKNYLQEELKDLTSKYKEIVAMEHQVSLEKDRLVNLLIDASGITTDGLEVVHGPGSDVAILIDRCLQTIKERNSALLQSSCIEMKVYERMQSLVCTSMQESVLNALVLEEEMMLNKAEVTHLSDQLEVAFLQLSSLKDEKGFLQKDLERAEEKTVLLREKLSMAVKKGKGLVQERENLKQRLEDKTADIEKLKQDIQQQGLVINNGSEQVNMLSTDFSKLEADFVVMKDQKDRLEQFLMESNRMLQRVMESIDCIVVPEDSDFIEPVEKVKWLIGFLSECQDAKSRAEAELEKFKNEAVTLTHKLEVVQSTTRSLEDSLSVAKDNISQLLEGRRELEVSKTHVEEELQKAMGEASQLLEERRELEVAKTLAEEELQKARGEASQLFEGRREFEVAKIHFEEELQKAISEASSASSKLAAVSATKKSLEDALSQAENNIALLISEKEDTQTSGVVFELELQKAEGNVSVLTSKLAESHNTTKSLDDTLSKLQTDFNLLSEENNKLRVGRDVLEDEIKKLKEDADSQTSKIVDSSSIIESLQDELFKAENSISGLLEKKTMAELEISTLNSKLSACMEELEGTHGSLENRLLELSVHLNSLQLLLKDKSLLSLLTRSFGKKVEILKDMNLLLSNVRNQFVEIDYETHQNYECGKEDSFAHNPLSDDDNMIIEMVNGEENVAYADSILLYVGKTVEGFQLRDKILADKFERFSTLVDKMIFYLYEQLEAISGKFNSVFEEIKSLRHQVNTSEAGQQGLEEKITMLENEISFLSSACTKTVESLDFVIKNNFFELHSGHELEKLIHNALPERTLEGESEAELQQWFNGSKYVKQVDKLLLASSNVQVLDEQFQNLRNRLTNKVEDLQNNLMESKTICEKTVEERDLNQQRVLELESSIKALQDSCKEMRLKLEEYQAKEFYLIQREADLTRREAELSSIYSTKEPDERDSLLSNSQMKFLMDKINAIEIPFANSEIEFPEPLDSMHVKKLFSIVYGVPELQNEVTSLSLTKQNLQSTLEKQGLEIEYLKKKVEEHARNEQDSEERKNDFSLLKLSMENVIQKLGGNEMLESQKSAGPLELLLIIEKTIVANILESEYLKSNAQELDSKLLETQKFVGELSGKIKLLEESKLGRPVSPDSLRERNISEASLPSHSEISEVEEMGPAVQKSINPVPPSAHVRTLRKGSSDHLAIDVDSESLSLINHEETAEDKGHVFKSLNTSGLIPKQGKVIADRIDGFWVSGGRALMSHPRARVGLIVYWLFLHIWLVGTFL